MRRVEKEADPAVLREWALPPYREALFRATGRTNRAVVVGRDGRLFFRDHVFGYATSEARLRVERLGRLAGALTDHCAENGGVLVTVPIPNKETMIRDRFETWTPPPGELYSAILGAWRRRGLVVVDLRPALDPGSGAAWFKTDTHWTYAGARASAASAADSLRVLRDEGALGPRTATEFRAFPPVAYRGDLYLLLGFPDESPVGARFSETVAPIGGLLADGSPAESAKARPLVVAGSSASLRFGFAGSLGAELGLAVESRSADGSGFAGSLFTLLRDVDAGLRPMPRAIVWEFVERSVQYEAEANERELFDWLLERGQSPEYARTGHIPLRPSEADAASRGTDVATASRSGGTDSRPVRSIAFDVGDGGAAIPCDGTWAFSVRLAPGGDAAGAPGGFKAADAVEMFAVDAGGGVVAGPYIFAPPRNGGRITLAVGSAGDPFATATASEAATATATATATTTATATRVPLTAAMIGRGGPAVRFVVRSAEGAGPFRATDAELRGRRP